MDGRLQQQGILLQKIPGTDRNESCQIPAQPLKFLFSAIKKGAIAPQMTVHLLCDDSSYRQT